MIAALLLMVSIDSTSPAVVDTSDALERVERWVDTVSEQDPGNYQYLNPFERSFEQRRLRERQRDVDLEPTHYPSPFRRLDRA